MLARFVQPQVATDRLIVLAIALLGVLLRFARIGIPDPMVDDAMAIYFAKFPVPEILSQLYRAEAHPWGFYVFIHYWMHLVGPQPDAVTARSLIFLWCQGIIPYVLSLFYLNHFAKDLGMEAFYRWLLLFAFSTNSTFVEIATRDLRMYSWLILFLLLATRSVFLWGQSGRPEHGRRWAIFGGVAFCFHYYAGFYLIAQALYITRLRFHRGESVVAVYFARAVGFFFLLFPPPY